METRSQKPFVTTVTKEQAAELQGLLIEQGFTMSQPAYTLYSGKKPSLSCTVFTSLKLTVQGKGMSEFIEFELEPKILKNTAYTHPGSDIDTTSRIGIDEAGKGDFFGPLCIAGVWAEGEMIKELKRMGVRDSKSMQDKEVLVVAKKIKQTCHHHVVKIGPAKYNELYPKFHNLNALLAWGHATAIENIVSTSPCKKVIIDQFANESLVINAVKRKKIEIDLTQRHRGEEDIVVAAASILARAAFLEGLKALGDEVGFELPKGANGIVIEKAKALVEKKGKEILSKVSKSHFRTTGQVLGE